MVHAEAHDPSVAKTEFRATIAALGIAQHRVAQLFGVGPRSIRRWQDGDRRVPCGVGIVLRLLACGAVTVDQVEQAAVAIPARTNGSAKLEPPAPLLVAPAPEQSPWRHRGSRPRRPRSDHRRKGRARSPRGPAAGRAAILGALIFTSAAVRLPGGPTANITAPWPTRRR